MNEAGNGVGELGVGGRVTTCRVGARWPVCGPHLPERWESLTSCGLTWFQVVG